MFTVLIIKKFIRLIMTEIKWKIDAIRNIIFFKEKTDFLPKEWSKLITQREDCKKIIQEDNGLKRHIEITDLDNERLFNLIYTEKNNSLELVLVFKLDEKFYSYEDIVREFKNFSDANEKFLENLKESFIRIGYVTELSIPIEDEKKGCNILRTNITSLENVSSDLDEINYKTNKTYYCDNIKVNQVILCTIGKKITISINPENNSPKATIQKNVLMNIDVNTDGANTLELNFEKINTSMKNAIFGIIERGGNYD